MVDATAALIKVIFLFNLAFLILGIIVIYNGFKTNNITGSLEGERIEDLDRLVSSVLMVSKIVILIGFVIAFISFLGCCGAFVESPSILTWYIFSLILLIAFQVCITIYVHQTKGINKDEAKSLFHEAIKKYTHDVRYKSFVDGLQVWLQCCGASKADDWQAAKLASTAGDKNNTIILPPSCCLNKKDPCDKAHSHKTSCADAIDDLVKNFQTDHVWYIGVVIGFQVILIIFTFYVRGTIRERQDLFELY